MNEFPYQNLRFLIADDFSNFRKTVGGMLRRLGVSQIDTAATGADVITQCEKSSYDVILCDYDLGAGKNGQQVLEELRHRSLISRRSLFVLVSAESSKVVFMAAYDCEPDDYLMKPVTGSILQRRLNRLLTQRQHMMPALRALEAGDRTAAIALLTDLSLAQGRHATAAQKLLGELFLAAGEVRKAEKLYTRVLESRPLDWARLGLARAKQLHGELELAGQWLQNLVGENPLYLPAYDALANNWEQCQKNREVQETVSRASEISPKSILRQKRLARVAERNRDWRTCLRALRAVLKLGESSCHGSAEDSFAFARIAVLQVEKKLEPAQPLVDEARGALLQARQRFLLTEQQTLLADLLALHTAVIAGEADADVEPLLSDSGEASLEVQVRRVALLAALGQEQRAESLAKTLVTQHSGDENLLEQLDAYLTEPVTEAGRRWVAELNRQGIALYDSGAFDEALTHFQEALSEFPKHLGIRLNILQALIGKMRADSGTPDTVEHISEAVMQLRVLITPGHPQFERFCRLKEMAGAYLVTAGQAQ